jgi:hypothetical protein
VCQQNTAEVCEVNGSQTCNARCQWGACVCRSGSTQCGNVCALTKSDVNNCGACGHVCKTTDPHASVAGCFNGTCQFVCNDGFSMCNGVCVDENVDSKNCGGCGNVCTTTDPNASGASCDGSGDCMVSACNAGYSLCDGACVDEGSDPNNCGACDSVCPAGCTTGVCDVQ